MDDNGEDMYDEKDVVTVLADLLEHAVERPLRLDDPAARTVPLWNLGLTSSAFMRLLADIEDKFGVVWDVDDSADAVSSFDTLTAHVAARATLLPEEAR
jgi:acyl carrier protein